MHRGKRTSEAGVQLRKCARQPCKYYLKGICTKSPCDSWHPPECQFYKSESGCKSGNERPFPHREVEEQPNKKPKMGSDKNAVAFCFLKNARQLGCVFQDTEPPESFTDFTEEHTSLGINSTGATHKSYAASCKHPRKQRFVAHKNSSQSSSSARSVRFEI